jgi:hypothetical protein
MGDESALQSVLLVRIIPPNTGPSPQHVHQGKRCEGRTPMETFEENLALANGQIRGMSEEDRLAAAM